MITRKELVAVSPHLSYLLDRLLGRADKISKFRLEMAAQFLEWVEPEISEFFEQTEQKKSFLDLEGWTSGRVRGSRELTDAQWVEAYCGHTRSLTQRSLDFRDITELLSKATKG
jgi:hypothetical protein